MADTSPADMMAKMLGLELYVVSTTPARGPGIAERLAEHLEYQVALERAGKLFGAGPLSEIGADAPESGLIILRASDEAEARALADADPLHQSGVRSYTLRKWRLNEGAMTVTFRYSDQTMTLE
jgi:uncharacterized protein YciI